MNLLEFISFEFFEILGEIIIFHKMWDVFDYYLFKFSFCLSPLCTLIMYMLAHLLVSHTSLGALSIFVCLFVCSSDWIALKLTYIQLRWFLSFSCSDLFLSPYSKIFISINVLYSSRIFIWFFVISLSFLLVSI